MLSAHYEDPIESVPFKVSIATEWEESSKLRIWIVFEWVLNGFSVCMGFRRVCLGHRVAGCKNCETIVWRAFAGS